MTVAIENKARCCKVCDNCTDCYVFTVAELRGLVNTIDQALSEYGKSLVQKLNWGYACQYLSEPVIDQLRLLRGVVTRFMMRMRQRVQPCLCDAEFQKIKDRVLTLIGVGACNKGVTDIVIDDSGIEAWAIANPGCVPVREWEAWVRRRMQDIIVIADVVPDPETIRTIHALVSADTCFKEIGVQVSACKAEARTITATAMAQRCQAEYMALGKSIKRGISQSLYAQVRECGVSPDLIAKVVGCGGRFGTDGVGAPTLKIGADVARLDDILKLSGGIWPEQNQIQ